MEFLLQLIPHGVAVGLLVALPVIRGLIKLTDEVIAKSPDKHDDAGWARIKQSTWFIALETILKYGAGLELPKHK
jgi:hypothetical protein